MTNDKTMLKILSHHLIALTLIFGFIPTVKSITISETQNKIQLNSIAQNTTKDPKQATAEKLFLEGYKLSQQGTKESSLQAIEKFKQAVPLFRELGKKEIEVVMIEGIGLIYSNLGEKQQALNYYDQALTLRRELKDQKGIGTILNHTGNVYSSLGEKEKALDYYHQALTIYKKIADIDLQASTLSNISTIYSYLGEMQKSLDYLNQALLLYEELDDDGKGSILNNIGNVYSDLGEKQKALDYLNQALLLHRKRKNRRDEATTLNNIGNVYSDLGEKQKALDYLNQALSIHKVIPNFNGVATTLNNIASIYNNWGETQTALDYFNQALTIAKETLNPRIVAASLNNLGSVYKDLGEIQQALDYYNQALIIYQQLSDPAGKVITLSNISLVYNNWGEIQKALDYLNQALPIAIALKNPQLHSTTLNNLGSLYHDLGEPEQALDFYNQSLFISQKIGNRSGEANTLNNIGGIYDGLRDNEKALDFYNQALQIHQNLNDTREQANTLNNVGSVYLSLGKSKKALTYYQQVLSLNQQINNPSIEAITLNNIGMTYDSLGEKQQALEYLNQALPLITKIRDLALEAVTFNNISLINYNLKNYEIALEYVNRAIEIVEEIRNNIASNDLKTSYFATVEDYYKHKINILMKLHQQNPNTGYDVLAFETSERGKARSLLELLEEANIDIRQGISSELVTAEKQLQIKLNALEKRRINLCINNCSQRLFNNLETQRSELLEQYKQVQAKIRDTSPKYSELTQPKPIQLQQLQQLLDEDTVLWQYSLDERQSYVWMITQNSFTTHQLPSREEIVTVAREYHTLLQYESRQKKLNSTATKLSKLILPPLTDIQEKSRLVIVSDGALQYIPFATLPLAENKFLLEFHQIINLPSSSVLARLRANQNRTQSEKKQLAIFADPIFSKSDPRLPQKQAPGTEDLGGNDLKIRSFNNSTSVKNNPKSTVSPSSKITDSSLRSALRSSDLQLARLKGTETEAKDILDLVPPSQKTSVFGFDANLEFATSPELSKYSIIHFATHGILNSEKPELSGIVLSLFDQQGNPQNGFLRLHEIFNLNLPADLVVLSACQTGLGKEIRGEGLVGLTRGFMYAGATRVLVSLWSVDDAATAEFMSKFYNFMLRDKLSPAAALNETQKYMQNHSTWSHPYYWAAFTLQGDWVNN